MKLKGCCQCWVDVGVVTVMAAAVMLPVSRARDGLFAVGNTDRDGDIRCVVFSSTLSCWRSAQWSGDRFTQKSCDVCTCSAVCRFLHPYTGLCDGRRKSHVCAEKQHLSLKSLPGLRYGPQTIVTPCVLCSWNVAQLLRGEDACNLFFLPLSVNKSFE